MRVVLELLHEGDEVVVGPLADALVEDGGVLGRLVGVARRQPQEQSRQQREGLERAVAAYEVALADRVLERAEDVDEGERERLAQRDRDVAHLVERPSVEAEKLAHADPVERPERADVAAVAPERRVG